MEKMKKVFSVLIFFSLFCFIFAGKTLAKVIVQEKGTVDIAKDEVINDDLFVGAETVNIEGTVNGDVFVGAGSVKESGVVNGNLHIGGGNVTIGGRVLGNLYIGGGSVNLQSAKVGGSVISGSGILNIDAESSIGGSLISGCGTVNNQAPVGRNVFIGAGTIFLNSKVGGEVKVGGGKIDIGPRTNIVKDLSYVIEKADNFNLSPEATVGGEIRKTEQGTISNKKIKENIVKTSASVKIVWTIFSFLGALIVGFILIKLLPKPVLKISEQVKSSFFQNLGVGLLILVLAFPVLILVAVTGVGLPLSGIAFAFLMTNLYFSKLAVGTGVGLIMSEKLGWKKMSLYGKFAVGLLVTYLAMKVPLIGWFLSLLVTFTGLGALMIFYRNSLK